MKYQTAFTSSHHKATEVGQKILDDGGTASEAMVAAAAMIAVQYPHMNSIGGDSFWLISKQGETPIAIDGCGATAIHLDVGAYRKKYSEIPVCGGEASITMAGTISAWQKALEIDASGLTLLTLLQPAIDAVRNGIKVTQSLAAASEKTFERLRSLESFAETFLKDNQPLKKGDNLVNQALAKTFTLLAENGLNDFYQGEIAETAAKELQALGSPICLEDFHSHQAKVMAPLNVTTSKGKLFNFGAPTQGVASLLILAMYDRLAETAQSEVDHIHLLVEATKQAFIIRDETVCDETYLTQPLQALLDDAEVERCTSNINLERALPWPRDAELGDTVWMGATDQYGTMVSFIQSIYWEFGSGIVLPSSGILWNVRSKSFSLDSNHHNVLAAAKKPFHTLNPAYAELNDGSRMVYGTMGGEGQPQTQACLFSRYHYQGFTLSDSVAKPRWLLGRTWGDSSNNLRLERSLYDRYGEELRQRGHIVTDVADENELMGHAGAIVISAHGKACATSDPRSDGSFLIGNENE